MSHQSKITSTSIEVPANETEIRQILNARMSARYAMLANISNFRSQGLEHEQYFQLADDAVQNDEEQIFDLLKSVFESENKRAKQGHFPSPLVRNASRDAFVDEFAFAEPVHVEFLGQRAVPFGHQFRHGPARPRDRLKPAGAPATVDEHTVHRGF